MVQRAHLVEHRLRAARLEQHRGPGRRPRLVELGGQRADPGRTEVDLHLQRRQLRAERSLLGLVLLELVLYSVVLVDERFELRPERVDLRLDLLHVRRCRRRVRISGRRDGKSEGSGQGQRDGAREPWQR